jgi:FkbM family methyltransferase
MNKLRFFFADLFVLFLRVYPFEKGKTKALKLIDKLLPQGDYPLDIKLRFSSALIHGFRNDLLSLRLYAFGEDEPNIVRLLRLCLKNGNNVFLDIGSNIGSLAIPVSKHFNCPSVCFEPQPLLANTLSVNAAINNVSNLIRIFPIALGATNGFTKLFVNSSHLGEASVKYINNSKAIDVPIKRLDDVLNAAEWLNVALVKIDVEGHELSVIEGMISLLALYQPPIVFEVNRVVLDDPISDPLMIANLLRSVGYSHFHVVDKFLYPPQNGAYIISNIMASTDSHLDLVHAYGYSDTYSPPQKPFLRVRSIDL